MNDFTAALPSGTYLIVPLGARRLNSKCYCFEFIHYHSGERDAVLCRMGTDTGLMFGRCGFTLHDTKTYVNDKPKRRLVNITVKYLPSSNSTWIQEANATNQIVECDVSIARRHVAAEDFGD